MHYPWLPLLEQLKMPIPWTIAQRQAVTGTLQKYPPASNHCEEAADEILPVAREQDAKARVMRIKPKGRAPFVVPKFNLARPWFEHFTTEVVVHYVDALTGPEGTMVDDYLQSHWKYPDCLDVESR